jgi:manganese efflux pump family protein
MSFLTIVFIGFALAMDACAVAISSGVTIRQMRLSHALRIAAFFGLFQALMPVAGWSVGRVAADVIQTYDHWVAFLLLLFVGGKMIWEAFRYHPTGERNADPHNLYILITLAFATSIDAAAVGVTLSFLDVRIIEPALIIGVITFFMSWLGTYIGKKFGDLFGRKMEIVGGVVLIAIGLKIVIEHEFFA